MFYSARKLNVSHFRTVLCLVIIFSLISCGGSDSENTDSTVRPGASPFIAFVDLHVSSASDNDSVQFSIQPKPGSVSRPVNVTYSFSYLRQRGYLNAAAGTLTIPVFGLYQNYSNQVTVQIHSANEQTPLRQITIVTAAYSDPAGIYDHPNIRKARANGAALGFDFFFMKSTLGSPVVVDTDGEMRWVVPGTLNSFSSLFQNGAFVIGDQDSLKVHRLELDGTAADITLSGGASDLSNFHHNIDPGKVGVLGEVDANDNGVWDYENRIVEFDPTSGAVLKQWSLGDIISQYMSSQGDDPTAFVRPGFDWFHMNSVVYDPSDDSLIVSSRENFVIKIDYSSGSIIWILGDPTKYWHTFPSLAAKSLTVAAAGFYPIGQHSVTITHDGYLMLFDDGAASNNQPAGQPAGESRTYSVVSRYSIDAGNRSAVEVSRFDYGQSIFSAYCSSAYESASDASSLVDYAEADNATHARLVGLALDQTSVVFDFEYATAGCSTSWNALPIAFDGMSLQ
jgi:arylsulfate sulfotransferase